MEFYQIDSKSMLKSQVLSETNARSKRKIEVKSHDVE